VVFVRFKDDVLSVPSWPDYNVLPNWASTIVDPTIPANNIFTPLNMTDFFDRASGGDGNGTLGAFRMIGDVYYVTTDENESFYSNNVASVNEHVLNKLNATINYANYDNWTFMEGGEFWTHDNHPDGIVDYIFMIWRDCYPYDNARLGEKRLYANLVLDGKAINDNCGSNQWRYANKNSSGVDVSIGGPYNERQGSILVPAHEFTHYIFGGTNYDGHLDGHVVYGTEKNTGNVAFFALMTSNSSAPFCAYERYRAGWLNPIVYESANAPDAILLDTHVKNQAIMIPVRRDADDEIVEYFLIENFHTRNDYTQANPFLRTQVFNHTLRNGLLVFHIENEDKVLPAQSVLDIECADGLWDWDLSSGQSTPSDQSDDWIYKATPSPGTSTGFDDRDEITISVGGLQNRYLALTPGSGGPPVPRRGYFKDASLGENEDFFRNDETSVFTRWSNPSTNRLDLSVSNKGFQVIGYNPTTKAYTLKVAVDYSGVLDLAPSEPQNLHASKDGTGAGSVSWPANFEPDVNGYNVYRAIYYSGGPTPTYIKVNGPLVNSTSFVDNNWSGISIPPGTSVTFRYRVTAVDNQTFESMKSDSVEVIYTWQEYLLAAAYQNKSVSSQSTAFNGQRKLYRESGGKLHEVFESGGEVFYRRSSDNGSSWEVTRRLSNGWGGNSSACLTGRYSGYATFLYTVWQGANGSNWDIVYNYSNDGGTTWQSNALTHTSAFACPDPGPRPVILAGTPSNSFELMTVYRTANNLKSSRTTSTTPSVGSWATSIVNGTNAQSRNPSLAYAANSYGYYRLVWNENNSIYHQTFYGSSWSGSTCVSSGAYLISDQSSPSFAVTSTLDKHIVWEGNYTYTGKRVIVTNKNLSSTYNIISSSTDDYYGSTVSGNDNDKATVAWYDGANNVRYTYIVGGSPSGNNFVSSNSRYPSLSLNNPPGGLAKLAWTLGSQGPYTVQIGTQSFQKTSGSYLCSRMLNLSKEGEGWISVGLGPIEIRTKDGLRSCVVFQELDDVGNDLDTDPLGYLRTVSFTLPSDADSLVAEQLMMASDRSSLAENLEVNMELVAEKTGSVLRKFGTFIGSELSRTSTVHRRATLDNLGVLANSHIGETFFVRIGGPSIERAVSGAKVSLCQVFETQTESEALPKGGQSSSQGLKPVEFALFQNFPNPFNPSTALSYQMPSDGFARLSVFDVLGREVAGLVDEFRSEGYYTVRWDAGSAASGVYYARFVVTNDMGTVRYSKVIKLLLMK
jgi:hypothetical protein